MTVVTPVPAGRASLPGDDAVDHLDAGCGLHGPTDEAARPWRGAFGRNAAPLLVLLVGFNAAVLASPLLAARCCALGFVLVVPGAVILSLTPLRPREAAVRFAWSVGASVLLVMSLGLLLSEVLPHLGDVRPLSRWTLTSALDLVTVAAGSLRCRAADPLEYLTRGRGVSWGQVVVAALLALVPLAAVAGAERLDNGDGSALAVAALVVVGCGFVAATVAAPRIPRWILSWWLCSASAATLLGTTMRSDYPFGFDIQTEYRVFTSTLAVGVWHVPPGGNAYAAMLSITILPTVLAVVSHVSGIEIFKLVYALVFSVFPCLVLATAARWFPVRAALVGSIIVIAQGFYAASIGSIARQDIGLLYFALFVVTAFDASLVRRVRQCAVVVAGAGMAVSHYSTAYFACLVVAIGYVVLAGTRSVRCCARVLTRHGGRTRPARRMHFRSVSPPRTGAVAIDAPMREAARRDRRSERRSRRALLPTFSLPVVLAVLGVVYAWNVWITRSAQNVTNLVSSLSEQGLQLLPASHGSSLIERILDSDIEPTVAPGSFVATAVRYYREHDPWLHPYPASLTARYPVQPAGIPSIVRHPPAFLPGLLAGVIPAGNELLLAAVGLGALCLLWQRRRAAASLALELAVMTFGCVCVLAVLRTSGTVSSLYNAPRGQVQGSILFSVGLAALCTGLGQLLARRRLLSAVAVAVASMLGALLLFENSGLSQYSLGGGGPENLVNFGEGYEAYYFTDADMASARWLAANLKPHDVLYADPYGALQLAAVSPFGHLVETLIPGVMEPNAYVYAYSTNLVDGTTRASVAGEASIFAFPRSFLERVKDTVFTTGTTAVYR